MVHVEKAPERYQLSFTFGGLLVPETRAIVDSYRDRHDWQLVKSAVLEKNLLGKTRSASSRRYFREIRYRLERAYPWELDVIADGGADAQTVLFAVFTRYYRLVGDFVSDFLRPRVVEGLRTLDTAMFRSFVADQAVSHPELASISDSTAAKLTSVTIRTLREAGIISGRRGPYGVTPPPMSAELRMRYCAHGDTRNFTNLLWTDEEIKPCLK